MKAEARVGHSTSPRLTETSGRIDGFISFPLSFSTGLLKALSFYIYG